LLSYSLILQSTFSPHPDHEMAFSFHQTQPTHLLFLPTFQLFLCFLP
jgi:hypothetical protein